MFWYFYSVSQPFPQANTNIANMSIAEPVTMDCDYTAEAHYV